MHDVVVGGTDRVRKHFGRSHLAMIDASRGLAECAPHALELAGVGIENDDAMVAVAVGDEKLVRTCIDPRIGGPMHVGRVVVAFALIAAADLEQEFAVERELEERIVGNRLQSGIAAFGTVVAANPDMLVMIDVYAMLALRPF